MILEAQGSKSLCSWRTSGPEQSPTVALSRLFCKQTDGQMWVTPQLMLTPLTTNYLFVCGVGPAMVLLSLWDQRLTYFQTSWIPHMMISTHLTSPLLNECLFHMYTVFLLCVVLQLLYVLGFFGWLATQIVLQRCFCRPKRTKGAK